MKWTTVMEEHLENAPVPPSVSYNGRFLEEEGIYI